MKLIYTERALADVDLAVEWYESQRMGLGHEFLDCLEVGILPIIDRPAIYQKRYKDIRSVIIRRFPFSVLYTIESQEIVVHAVFDNRQNPEKMP
ncbi:MAG: type II toxin-antitoxin system RelE/ParE family toxin [Proteobacteria bacterium]|nr:type II toxin-antitoxin system RelE/ParE family toxin [Pseudomonadota bacterium]